MLRVPSHFWQMSRQHRRAGRRDLLPHPHPPGDLGPCPTCGRPIIMGPSANRHHWQPKSKGGREWSWLHRICHRKIHSLWGESELLRAYDTPQKILDAPEITRFVQWVSRKHPEFYDGSADRRR